MPCNLELRVCERYKALKPKEGGRYASGQARCQTCEIYIYWAGLLCPCCNTRLRRNPRSIEYKDKMKQQLTQHL